MVKRIVWFDTTCAVSCIIVSHKFDNMKRCFFIICMILREISEIGFAVKIILLKSMIHVAQNSS
jgi:hypothetical protein